MLVTSPFGTRKDPLDASKSQLHKGIDIQTNHEAVLATEDKGKVVNVNSNANTNGGRSVTVEYNRNDGSKYQCTYMHLDSISVKIGDEVAAGQKLGFQETLGIGLLVNIFILELYPYPQMEQKEILTRLHILLRFHKKGTSHYRFSVTEKI